jgi:hypothetical protein
MPITRTDEFGKNLEAQQNLVAGYSPNDQLTVLEDLMAQQVPWQSVLRSVVLMSLTSGGIKVKNLEAFKRDFLQVSVQPPRVGHLLIKQIYGYHHLFLLIALQNLNLLVKSPSSAPLPFSQVRKALRLIVDDIDDAAPNDISYVYSGYAPLSIRLVQCVTQKNAILSVAAGNEDDTPQAGIRKKELPKAHPISGWKGFEDVLGSIPGATVDVRQKADKLPGQGELSVLPTMQWLTNSESQGYYYDRGLLLGRLHIYRNIGIAVDVEADER